LPPFKEVEMARKPEGPWYREERDQWCVKIGGRRIKLAEGRENKREAEAKFHALMLERAVNPAPEGGKPTVVSIAEAYLAYAERHMEARSFYERKSLVQQFTDAHGFRLVADCQPYHLSRWLDSNRAWKSDWTLNTVASVIKRVFDWAAGEGFIPANPFKGVSRPPGQPRRPITPGEIRKLMRGAPGRRGKRFRMALAFLCRTGARPGEMAAMKWSDIDLENCRIVLREHKTARKVRKPRVIPLTPDIVRLLEQVRRRYPSEAHVFLGERGNPWNRSSLSLRIQRCRERQGIPEDAKLYGVRHFFGTTAIVNGVDIKTLAQLMGHASTRMTEHYLHLSGEAEHLARAMLLATSRRPGASGKKPSEPGP
jgi:integrase